MSSSKKTVEVVAAVIHWGEAVLCVQRGKSHRAYISEKWEFPGGKLEAGESQEQGLRREIEEELKMIVRVGDRLTTVRHGYPDFDLVMHAFLCSVEGAHRPEPTLTEHINMRWMPPLEPDFAALDWAAADVPIVHLLTARANG